MTHAAPQAEADGIVVEDVARVAGRRHLVRGVSFRVGRGDVLVLVGPNGAGKSTLLSLLAGRLKPDRGRVRVVWGGTEPRGEALRALVAFLPHESFLYADLTARENLRFFAAWHRRPHADRVAAEVLDRVGLEHDADRTVRMFSRGMQQRLAIGRLLVTGAPIWLLDEPSSGLDMRGRQFLWETIEAHVRDGGIAVLSSHDLDETARLATRILAIRAGRVVLDAAGGAHSAADAFACLEREAGNS